MWKVIIMIAGFSRVSLGLHQGFFRASFGFRNDDVDVDVDVVVVVVVVVVDDDDDDDDHDDDHDYGKRMLKTN